jgi:uncharacterized protein YyaL (SSP411 family)
MNNYFKKLLPLYFIIRDQIPLQSSVKISNLEAIERAMNWLCIAQDASQGGGVSTGYDLRKGWLPPFPETTGYIIPTFFNYYHFTKNENYRMKAIAMLDWLLEIQESDGSISGIIEDATHPLVFDTGQVLFGFVRGYQETGAELYLYAAQKAGDWLVKHQDEDGKWSRHVCLGISHAYHTRVAWALVELNEIIQKTEYIQAAVKNCNWGISCQLENGWFRQNYFSPGQPVYTHMIAYATRGLIEVGERLKSEAYLKSAKKVADIVLALQYRNGSVPGSFNEKWEPTTSASCLTGNAQLSIIWSRLFQITGQQDYFNAVQKINRFLIRTQERSAIPKGIRGAIKGSHPINGNYLAYSYPNWAAKFFVDALMLECKIDKG